MIPYIKAYEPVRGRLRIRNKLRFILFLLFILCTLSTFFIPKMGKSEVQFQPYRVGYGDTYWDIAKELQQAGYRPKDDIRNVVSELIKASGIPAHKLREGDIIMVPVIDQTKEKGE